MKEILYVNLSAKFQENVMHFNSGYVQVQLFTHFIQSRLKLYAYIQLTYIHQNVKARSFQQNICRTFVERDSEKQKK